MAILFNQRVESSDLRSQLSDLAVDKHLRRSRCARLRVFYVRMSSRMRACVHSVRVCAKESVSRSVQQETDRHLVVLPCRLALLANERHRTLL